MENEMCFGGKRRKFSAKWAAIIPIVLAAGVFIFGHLIMYLWNAILPEVLGVHTITFWQAVGILILSKILFGGFHGHHGHRGFHNHRRDMKEKWMNLSPEEKEIFRQRMGSRFNPEEKPE